MTTPTPDRLTEALETLRTATRTDPADRFWEGYDAALMSIEVALVPDIRRAPVADAGLDVVYAVVFSNYDPAETDSLWLDKVKAEARAEELNKASDWEPWAVHPWRLEDAATPTEPKEPA